MPHYRKLIGERVYLSPSAPEDADLYARWENDLRVALPLGPEATYPISENMERGQIDQAERDRAQVFAIVTVEGDIPIGRCMLFDIDPLNQKAMMGILIGEAEYRGKGYGAEALRLLLDYGFNILNLHNIMLGVLAFNTPAIRCYQSVGFKEFGRRRQCRLIAGQRYDAIFMDLLADEFQSGTVAPLMRDLGG